MFTNIRQIQRKLNIFEFFEKLAWVLKFIRVIFIGLIVVAIIGAVIVSGLVATGIIIIGVPRVVGVIVGIVLFLILL